MSAADVRLTREHNTAAWSPIVQNIKLWNSDFGHLCPQALEKKLVYNLTQAWLVKIKLQDLSDQNILLMNVRLKLVAFTAQRAQNYANATPPLFETLCKPADSDCDRMPQPRRFTQHSSPHCLTATRPPSNWHHITLLPHAFQAIM
jgi:hypothetical protein